ncbi:phosphatidylglycerol:prolipoprotein diacylglycerol transferase [Paenibacillus sp. V4I3]|uniref:prolipoprotein diacylglyceryl transferase n=1 Tax=Paenibacillus sp. V4I3 TaxID=3042305 RepID=UPI002786BBC4|nr:prolipoprotein diacylglyceryl transferase [Paenibacillus sp. V4I3]MDQ0876584.1 phosphatidylglycerol:prolipoprotein diacylglycerol transferase [Paenibacillus sp. V4I3]
MRVILFTIAGYPIRSYGLLVAIAIILGLGVAYYLAKGTKYREHLGNIVFYAVIGAIIGARFWQVFFFDWAYYSQHLGKVIAIWEGGLSIQGGLVGGFIGGAIYTKLKKLDFWEIADILAPAIAFGQGVGRIACLLNGDAFGSPTGSNFGLVYPPGTIAYETYGSVPLFPAEVWEGQWDFVIFGLLLIFKNRTWFRGFTFLTYNILYALGRFMLEYLRGDTPRFLFHWTAAQWTSMTIIGLSVLLMGYFYARSKLQVKTA